MTAYRAARGRSQVVSTPQKCVCIIAMKTKRLTFAAVAAIALAFMVSPAQAGHHRHYYGGGWSVGYYQPAPYYYPVEYRPVYYRPAPVYYPAQPGIVVRVGR